MLLYQLFRFLLQFMLQALQFPQHDPPEEQLQLPLLRHTLTAITIKAATAARMSQSRILMRTALLCYIPEMPLSTPQNTVL